MSDKTEYISGRKAVKIEIVSVARVFMLACVAGSASIVIGVLFNSVLLSVITPIGIMGAYIIYMIYNDSDLPISIIGDSFYYLGFILTLVALVVSLISLASNAEVNMNNIVGSFGAALTTTIIGLIARLVVTSFSVQAKERRERLENEIERSLNRFSSQLDLLTTEVISSISKVHAQTESTLGETVTRFKTVHDEVLDQYIDTMANCEDTVKESIDGLASRLNAVEVSPDLVVSPLKKSLDGITSTLDQHQKDYEKINKNLNQSNSEISLQFSNTSSLVEDHISKLETEVSTAIQNQASELNTALSGIGSALVAELGDIKDLKIEAQDRVNAQLTQLSVELDTVVSSINGLRTPLEQSTSQFASSSETMSGSLHKLYESAVKVDEIINSMSLNADKASNIYTDLDELSLSIRSLNSDFSDVSLASQTSIEKLSAAARATEESSSQVAKDITDVYKQLALQIRALKNVT